MKNLCFSSLIILLYCSICRAGEDVTFQKHVLYEDAIRDMSTASLYVLVKITDKRLSTSKTVCTTANFLLGAIHRENELGYGNLENEKVFQVAINNKNHHFIFSKQEAIDNVPIYYTSDDLAVLRKRLKNLSTNDLNEGLGYRGNLLEIIFNEPYILEHFKNHQIPTFAFRDAFACVLVEKGFQVGKMDGSTRLYIKEQPM